MAMVIVSGNIDISVGALIGVLATVSGTLAVQHYPIALAWGAPLVIGMAVMALQGAVVAYLGIPAIVVTLGALSILKGGLISVTGGKWITDLPDNFHLADIELFGALPMPVVIMVVATALAAAWMRYWPGGRAIYATGGNPEAARLSGVSPRRTVIFVFAAHGFFAGVAALLFATQLRVIQSTTPASLELKIITAAVVGGVSILGGVRHGDRRDTGRHPDRRDHQRARIHQRLALLDPRRARRADPRHRHRRHPAPAPPPEGRLMNRLPQAPRDHPRRHPDPRADGARATERPLPHARQPAQPGPVDDRDRADRAADDLRHHHRRHRPLGRRHRRPVRDPARLFLEELGLPAAARGRCSRSASARWRGSATGS